MVFKSLRMKIIRLLPVLLFFNTGISQTLLSFFQAVPDELKENANSIIISNTTEITINSSRSYTIKKNRVIRVLNEAGLRNVDALEYYDKTSRIVSIEATMYNAFGKEIKKYRQRDFKDNSVADGFSLFTDNRVVYADIVPLDYPFTLVYTSEIVDSNTAFIPQWRPIDDPYESVVKATLIVSYPEGLGFRSKEMGFENYALNKKEDKNTITYSAENIKAIKKEDYAPNLDKLIPKVRFALDKFSLSGLDGEATNWNSLGSWMYSNLLADTEEIEPETIQKLTQLTAGVTDPIKKAQIIYKYVQDKTRYVSIQLGIGGWKPMKAKDVDRLGYGDCKALTNYTRSLLKAFGIPSYYTIVQADNDKTDFIADFVCLQGNHVILALPVGNEYRYLECTSQNAPFGFNGDFTDDRMVFLVKPEGGELIRTTSYLEKDNLQKIKGSYSFTELGDFKGSFELISQGVVYDNTYPIETAPPDKIEEHYKEALRNLQNLKLEKINHKNDKSIPQFTEAITCSATNFVTVTGTSLVFTVNAFNQFNYVPQRYRTRLNPFEIQRGFYDEDEIEIDLPEGYTIENKPTDFVITDKYGEYKAVFEVKSPTKLLYKRSFLMHKGFYQKTDYDLFRKFLEQVSKADNAKIILSKKI